jgi:hypothetical protein
MPSSSHDSAARGRQAPRMTRRRQRQGSRPSSASAQTNCRQQRTLKPVICRAADGAAVLADNPLTEGDYHPGDLHYTVLLLPNRNGTAQTVTAID